MTKPLRGRKERPDLERGKIFQGNAPPIIVEDQVVRARQALYAGRQPPDVISHRGAARRCLVGHGLHHRQ